MKTEKLSPVKIRAKKRAELAIQGKTYAEIQAQVSDKPSKYPRQAVYNALQTKAGQEALKEAAIQYYDENKVKRIINKFLDKADKGKLRANEAKPMLELAARSLGMLVDKVESKVQTEVVDPVASKSLVDEMLSEYALSNEGITSNSDIAKDVPVTADPNKTD